MTDPTNERGNGTKILYAMEFPCGIMMNDWLNLGRNEQDTLWQEHKNRKCLCTVLPSEYSNGMVNSEKD